MNEYVTILDFEAERVFQYKVETENTYDGYEYEDFITDKGHNLANCQWMVHENNDIVSHPDINNE